MEATPQEEETVEVEVPVRNTRAKRKLSSKKFTADLDAFLTQDMARSGANAAPPTTGNASAPKSYRGAQKTPPVRPGWIY